MIAAILVLAIAGADLIGWGVHRLVSPRLRFAVSVWGVALWSALVGVLPAIWTGNAGIVALTLVVGVLWAPVTTAWPVLTVAFLAVIGGWAHIERPIDGISFAFVPPALPVSAPLTTAVVGVALFLGLSANLICRAALDDARRRDQDGRPPVDRRPRAALERRWSAPPRRENEMRGGRLIGPLERWLITVLALVGAQGIVAALMAAKGIVRFPEISKNSGEGSKAEEFLIGSLVSWGLAGAGALLIATISGSL